MDVGERLLREIHDHPDDDAPRIVYADWLEQHGDDEARARADLIHAQIELEHAAAVDRPALHERIRSVLKTYRRRWTEGLTRAKIRGAWRFRRGFLDGGTMSATRFVKVAAEIFEHAPLLRSMIFPEASNELVELASCPFLERLVEVDLSEMCRCGRCRIEKELPALFSSPHAGNIRTLDLSDDRIDTDNARLLASSDKLGSLIALDLSGNQIEPAGIEAIAARGGNYQSLSLRGNSVGDSGAQALAWATALRVRQLDLSYAAISEVGAGALANAAWSDSIESLNVRGNSIGKGAERAALRARFGKRLKI